MSQTKLLTDRKVMWRDKNFLFQRRFKHTHVIVNTACSDAFKKLNLWLTFTENFELRSTPSVIGNVGQDAVLPCYISTGSEPPSMELQWKKMDVDTFIIVYQFTALTDKEIFGQGYQKRTTLAKDRVATGDVSLNLKKVQVADAGTYNCIVKSRNWSSVTQTVLKVSGQKPISNGICIDERAYIVSPPMGHHSPISSV